MRERESIRPPPLLAGFFTVATAGPPTPPPANGRVTAGRAANFDAAGGEKDTHRSAAHYLVDCI
jgi:hypothetical protein